MGRFSITPIDASLVALVILATEGVKKRVSTRFVPLIPIFFSLVFVVLAVLSEWEGAVLSISFCAKVLLESIKVSTLAMSGFKVYKTTIRGK